MNLYQFVDLIRQGANPQQIIINLLSKNVSNPFEENLVQLAKKGDSKELEKIARNLCASKGLDFDKEFAEFKRNLGL